MHHLAVLCISQSQAMLVVNTGIYVFILKVKHVPSTNNYTVEFDQQICLLIIMQNARSNYWQLMEMNALF